ncbi:unnamed protein product [Protopolystoma xenopodis]|uniref:Uncharacterized protein n=1 Tax=Protopolystoma xenopodis TaxID=117903 RepID=A0A3S5ALN6_9PLAT|nr:unnamed protein product [Protopolystoma xenopodis]
MRSRKRSLDGKAELPGGRIQSSPPGQKEARTHPVHPAQEGNRVSISSLLPGIRVELRLDHMLVALAGFRWQQ